MSGVNKVDIVCAQIFKLLEEKKVCTAAQLEEFAANGELNGYWFLKDVQRGDKYCLEGYLFPDTYEFYKNENPVAALDTLFDNFENKFKEEMYTRAEELGMTVDEIITLASMIEAEGDSPVNFAKISSVFHNRLKDNSGSFRLLG